MSQFYYGLIEGFYGRQWPHQQRLDYADFLQQHGFEAYIYAPKGDRSLRNHWREPEAEAHWPQLAELSAHYRQRGLRWGLGLSPLGLADAYEEKDRQQLRDKIRCINTLQPDMLCILFDDTRGDSPGLAQRQLQITEDIIAVSSAGQHSVCPTYYSYDPALETLFGVMPEDYWHRLGRELPASIDLFWTGNQVVSPAYCHSDLEQITEAFQRKPLLWDNYPVNDGRKTSQYLFLKPYSGRPWQLQQWTAGHLVNPMNQPALSELVLPSLAAVYRQQSVYNPDAALQRALDSLGNKELSAQLQLDLELFSERGLEQLTSALRDEKAQCYRQFSHPAAIEIVDWLAGRYAFDPECLT